MGGLTSTVSRLAAGEVPSAAKHNQLLTALDEVLRIRFNERSFRIFDSGTSPTLYVCDEYLFGTASNLQTAISAYDESAETPSAPILSGGVIDSIDTVGKYVWLHAGDTRRTLNRKWCMFSPDGVVAASKYWFGYSGDRAERWEPYRIADILVENYTETHSVGSPTTSQFTLRTTWDRHGIARIHNGNRFNLTVFDASNGTTWVLPPYGIRTFRKTSPTGSWTLEGVYMARTHEGDRLQWFQIERGNFASSMYLCEKLVASLASQEWARVKSVTGWDSTSTDQAKYTGTAPADTDKAADWLVHQGDILSVVLDKRDGTIRTNVLTWRGVNAVPDSTWAGIVTQSIVGGGARIRLTSAVSAPAGASDSQWEHDLIPISTNLLGPSPVAIHFGPTSSYHEFTIGSSTAPTIRQNFQVKTFVDQTTTTVYKPTPPVSGGTGGVAANVHQFDFSSSGTTAVSTFSQLVSDVLPKSSHLTGFTSDGSYPLKHTHVGLVRSDNVKTNPTALPVATFTSFMLFDASVDTQKLSWTLETGIDALGTRRRFSATIPRKYENNGFLSGGIAVQTNHPQEGDLVGTQDGQAGAISWHPGAVVTGQANFESPPPSLYSTAGIVFSGDGYDLSYGSVVWMPSDAIDYVLENINSPGWWLANRSSVIGGAVPESAKLRTMRAPRRIGEWNDLVEVLENVVYIKRVTAIDLHKDPMPSNLTTRPFQYAGESPFATPNDWCAGYWEESGTPLSDWAAAWGITVNSFLPNIAALESIARTLWEVGTLHYQQRAMFGTDTSVLLRTGDKYWDNYINPSDPGGPLLVEQWYRGNSATEVFDDYTPGNNLDLFVPIGIKYDLSSVIHTVELIDYVNGAAFSSFKAWSASSSRALFGGAGSVDSYRWVKRSDALAVFQPLGVAVPDELPHEPYNPELDRPANNPTPIAGARYSITPTTWTSLEIQGEEPIRVPNTSTPTWHACIDENTPFRLVDVIAGACDRISMSGYVWPPPIKTYTDNDYVLGGPPWPLKTSNLYWPTANIANTLADVLAGTAPQPVMSQPWYLMPSSQTIAYDLGSSDRVNYGKGSSRGMNPKSSEGGPDAYMTVSVVVFPFDVILSCSPVSAYRRHWLGEGWTVDEVIEITPTDTRHFAITIPAGTAVNAAYLNFYGINGSSAWICQWSKTGNQPITGFM